MNSLYPITQAGFIVVTFVYLGFLFYLLRKGINSSNLDGPEKSRIFYGIVVTVGLWLVIISILSSLQFFNDFSTLPPKFTIVVIVPLIVILWATSTPQTREILVHIAPHHILYLQSFRIFVELLLWMLFIDGILPFQMTFEGYNFDILAGLTGPIIGLSIRRNASPALLYVWNTLGLALLINIVSIAILSTPVPFRVFMNEPANTIVTQFPVVWLPGILVPLAYTLHILSIRQASALKAGERSKHSD
jgi:hypothetical protein